LNDPKKYIVIRGARVNNLKNINLDIPKYKFVVVTGLSGSGKSSLVFDTVYAEGQRRYVESLSSYARQFLEKMNKPDVDSIEGLAPSMAIEQKAGSKNSRSTVGTSTEIYDYLRLLFARVGVIYSPISNQPVKKDSPETVLEFLKNHSGKRIYVFCRKFPGKEKDIPDFLQILSSKGFYKIITGNELTDINESSPDEIIKKIKSSDKYTIINPEKKSVPPLEFLIDRFKYVINDNEIKTRLYDAVEMAFREGEGYLTIRIFEDDKNVFSDYNFSRFLERDGLKFEQPEPRLFSFNNPFGACKKCEGFSKTIDIDYDLVIPDKNKSITGGAIVPFTTPKFTSFLDDILDDSSRFNIEVDAPVKNLSQREMNFLMEGGKKFCGLKKFFKFIEKEASYKIHYRVLLNKYRAYTTCSECGGSRLRKESLYVKIGGKNIFEITQMKIDESYSFLKKLKFTEYEKKVSERIMEEILSRLKYLNEVGLSYLTLDRVSFTLSGGETQRINLSTSLGSSLVGSIYVLDEPTIGLHPSDNMKLIKIMKSLRNIGNTVLVVEHDKDMMEQADEIIDVGLFAGENGGNIVFQGKYKDILKDKESITGKYLSGREKISVPISRRPVDRKTRFLTVFGARANNLKDINVRIPLNRFVCITGVSGSGKSTLVHNIIYESSEMYLNNLGPKTNNKFDSIRGFENIDYVEMVDQDSIGKTTRSNPVTYIKAFDEIRELFSQTSIANRNHVPAGYFSFNVPGGRCETCEGTGTIKIEMQFMADIYLQCEVCGGKRYKQEILDVQFKGADNKYRNIDDVLNMTVSEALLFFRNHKRVIKKLK